MKTALSILLTVFFFCACGKRQQLKGKIFERRELEGNRLLIKYNYTLNNKTYYDSASMANVVINADSIFIIIDPDNPGKSIPEISR